MCVRLAAHSGPQRDMGEMNTLPTPPAAERPVDTTALEGEGGRPQLSTQKDSAFTTPALLGAGGRSSICEFPQTRQRVPKVSQRAALKLCFTVTNRTPSHWSNPDRLGPRCRSDALTGS